MKFTMILLFIFVAQYVDATVENAIEVTVTYEEVLTYPGNTAVLECTYDIANGDDPPVTVTWKVGEGPRYATDIYVCTGYTKATRSCTTQKVTNTDYANRIRIQSSSLVFTEVDTNDNRNYWCQVAVEGPHVEEQVDMKSSVLRVRVLRDETPKLNSITIEENDVGTVGQDVQIDCDCVGSYCGNVYWYKGPTDDANTQYDMVYQRVAGIQSGFGAWEDRTALNGYYSLVISGLTESDAGRYWCEATSGGARYVGEMGVDAKSTLLEVLKIASFTCEGKSDGLYSDPNECSKYYECSEERMFHRSCAIGTVFNQYFCDFPYNVAPPCGTKGTF